MENLSWFPFSILATVLFGVMMAFYKLPSARNHSKSTTAFWSFFTSAILASLFFFSYIPLTSKEIVIIALLWGGGYAITTLLQMYALTHIDTNALFPVTASGGLIAVVGVGMFFFNEYMTLLQMIGIAFAVITIFLFMYKGKKLQYTPLIILVGTGIIFISTFTKTLHKITADGFDIHSFMIYQYAFAALFALLLSIIFHRKEFKNHIFSESMRVGSLIGVFSFFGGYAWLIALTKGPFPLVASVHSFYILITAITGYFLFKERITKRKIFLIILAIISILFIRLG